MYSINSDIRPVRRVLPISQCIKLKDFSEQIICVSIYIAIELALYVHVM